MASDELLITPERLRHILRLGLDVYQTRQERAAMRGGLSDAACLCDAMAKEIVAQHALSTGRRHVPKAVASLAAAFTRCGDEITRMRGMVEVETVKSGGGFATALCHLCETVYPLDGSPHLCGRVRKLPMEGKVT